MRELKFRAWDKENKEMVEVGLLGERILFIKYGEWENIENFEVMQYTGLKDENGKEIYEKDILYDPVTNDFYVVTWDDSYAMFFLKNTKEDADKRDYGFVEYDTKVGNDLYIVGNVYANPELLNS